MFMIKRLLRNLRQKPKAVRDNIALGIAGVFTFIVGSFWLYNFPATHSLSTALEADDDPAFSGLFSDFKEQVATIKESGQKETENQATGTAESTVTRERVDISEFYPQATRAASVSTTSSSLNTTASSSSFGFSTTSTSQTTQFNTNTEPYSPPSETARSIRIVTTNSAASTSASTTPGQ